MKKLFLLILSLSLMLCCISCTNTKTYDERYDDRTIDYEDAQIVAHRMAEWYFDQIKWDGVYTAEDASALLYCYADKNSGEDISEEELQQAILKMLEYYYKTNEYFGKMSSGELLDDMNDIYGDYEE